jgi:60S ribosome subunit biogenesis protein NIP7
MRPLSDDELTLVLEKLKKFVGNHLAQLLDRPENPHVFRLHKQRVYYISETLLKKSIHIPKKNLVSAGTLFGKFTHSKKFRLHITCLDILAKLSPSKIWVKAGGEQSYVYGNHVVKAHIRRVTDETPVNGGVVILSEIGEIPLGFGTAAKTVNDIRNAGPETIVVYHQADTGEYLRDEAELF